jgi:phage major head subunit gpT-like protein
VIGLRTALLVSLATLGVDDKPMSLRDKALATIGVGEVPLGEIELRASAGGEKLTQAAADELLAKAVARERVSLFVSVLAYEQGRRDAKGNVVKNRRGIRVREGALQAMARSGKGTPFLRDHDQWDVRARGGTVLDSKIVKVAEGHFQVWQSVELTEPSAVERALRGLMTAVSIGMEAGEGTAICTACGTEVFSACYHRPFDVVDRKDGTKFEVEWEYTDPRLRETSEVPVGAVQNAGIQEIHAGLAALLSGAGIEPGAVRGNPAPKETHDMPKELLALLGLAADATADQVLAAIKALQSGNTADKAELAIANSKLAAFEGDIKSLKASERQRKEDEFINAAFSTGRIAEGHKEMWRALFAADEKRATELMGKIEPNTATPVNAPRQSAAVPAAELAALAPTLQPQPSVIEGGGIPGFSLYERGERSRVERSELAATLAAAVKALETHPDKRALWWAQRMGFQGGLRHVATSELSGGTAIANNADLDPARTAFRAVFMQALEMAAVSPLEMLYTTVPTNTPLARIHWMGDLPGFEEWTTDRALAGVEAFKLDLQSKKWANGLRIKNDDVKFDQLGLMPQQISGLATKARRHRLDRMAGMMIDGFAGGTTSNGLGYDGAFFFADAHRGGNDNKLAVALDATNLAAAELRLESMTTYDGNDALDVHGTHLIVGPKLRATAEKLLTQERLANGEDNYHRGKYKLIVENRFRGASDDYWYLGDLSHGIKPFIFQLVEEITTSAVMGQEGNNSMPSFMNDELLFGAQANYNMSYFEFRLLVGSVVA